MKAGQATPLTRGVFVRFTTDRFADQGVPRGEEGLTLHRDDAGLWKISSNGEYVDAYEAEFEVVGPALRPRGVVLPSLNGGWLAIEPYHERHKTRETVMGVSAMERWERQPAPSDFFGQVQLAVPGTTVGFPVLWDWERQLRLMYFLDLPDRMTAHFPQELHLEWPDPELQIDGVVTVDSDRGYYSKKAAELEITLRNPIGDCRTVSGHLIVPAYTCKQASEWKVDLFPSVSADDLDFV